MKKTTIIAHKNDQAKIVEALQDIGLVEIGEISRDTPEIPDSYRRLAAARADQLHFERTKVQFVIDFLEGVKNVQKGVIAGLIKDRVRIDKKQFLNADEQLDFERLYTGCEELDARRTNLRAERNRLVSQTADLRPWESLSARIVDIADLKTIGALFIRIKKADLPGLVKAITNIDDADLTVLDSTDQTKSAILLYHRAHKRGVESEIGRFSAEICDLARWQEAPAVEIERLQKRIEAVDLELAEIEREALADVDRLEGLVVLRDWIHSRAVRYEAQAKFFQTKSTFVCQGWIEARKCDFARQSLEENRLVIDFTFLDPVSSDNPPIVLRNSKWLKPFATLTKLYGMPNYRELDPTPMMGIFFFVFFGIALGDVGYGLVLAGFCAFLKRRLIITEAGRDWFNLFIAGGLASAMVGVLTGSYFGLETSSLPRLLRAAIVIDPLQQAFIFLLLTWVLGIIHLLVGLGMEFIDLWRQGLVGEAVLAQLPKIGIFFFAMTAAAGWMATTVFESKAGLWQATQSVGVTGLSVSALVYVISGNGLLSRTYDVIRNLLGETAADDLAGKTLFDKLMLLVVFFSLLIAFLFAVPGWPLKPIALALLVVGLFFSSLTRGGLGMFGVGLYNLYGMSGFIGDVLSYSRLMALGLATFLVGFVINTLAKLVVGVTVAGLPIGILLAILIAVPLHAVNLVINLLGAFVHPLRLQFVEFFSKFYENGGKAFDPFRYETDSLILKEE